MSLKLTNKKLKRIDSYPIYHINLSNNILKSIPDLPNTLISLDVRNNKLKILPELPETLESLIVTDNELEYIPKLPKGITTFCCSYNKLKELPSTSHCEDLEFVDCRYNKLQFLPRNPNHIWFNTIGNESTMIIPFRIEYPYFYGRYDKWIKIVKCIITIQRKFRYELS